LQNKQKKIKKFAKYKKNLKIKKKIHLPHVTSPSLECISPSRRKRDCQRRAFPWSLAAWCTCSPVRPRVGSPTTTEGTFLPHATNSLEYFSLVRPKRLLSSSCKEQKKQTCSNKLFCTGKKGQKIRRHPPCIYWPCLPRRPRLVLKLEISYRVIIYLEGFWFLLEDFLKINTFLHGEIHNSSFALRYFLM
jgi:hypothetical protein